MLLGGGTIQRLAPSLSSFSPCCCRRHTSAGSRCCRTQPLLKIHHRLRPVCTNVQSRKAAFVLASLNTACRCSISTGPTAPLQLVRVGGDGRCLFRAMAVALQFGIHGTLLEGPAQTLAADALRAAICDDMLKSRHEVEHFIDGDYDQYLHSMRQPHTWGGEPELAAAARCLQRPVTVYQLMGSAIQLIAQYGSEHAAKSQQICFLYTRFGHYDALLPGAAAAAL